MTAIWRPDIPTVQGCRQTVNDFQFPDGSLYLNAGSCVHPYGITGIEITDMQLTLVKWKMATRPDLSLFVAREVLIGPVGIT